ncbi:MAG: flagellar basal body rod protein FlgB [Salinarimonadaceae bacterium]|nr:MAG: flagellar basal body rod protein FlgB [Salinarimonadaceae bacterium]
MSVAGLPLIEMLKTRMHWHQARQKVIAENVANSDTPNFRPNDMAQPVFDARGRADGGSLTVARTNGAHLSLQTARAGLDEREANRFEVRPSGNAVNLEEEMLRAADNQSDFQLAASLYQKSLQLMRTAIGRR